jgi:hypothetical protein
MATARRPRELSKVADGSSKQGSFEVVFFNHLSSPTALSADNRAQYDRLETVALK